MSVARLAIALRFRLRLGLRFTLRFALRAFGRLVGVVGLVKPRSLELESRSRGELPHLAAALRAMGVRIGDPLDDLDALRALRTLILVQWHARTLDPTNRERRGAIPLLGARL